MVDWTAALQSQADAGAKRSLSTALLLQGMAVPHSAEPNKIASVWRTCGGPQQVAQIDLRLPVDVSEADWRTALRAAVVTTESRKASAVQTSGCALIEYLSAHIGDPVELHDGQSA